MGQRSMTRHVRSPWVTRIAAGLGFALLAAGVSLVADRVGALAILELRTYDWRMRLTARPSTPSAGVVIVEMNADSIRRLEPEVGRWPWPRLVHAAVIDFLARGRAKVVVYDALFTEHDVRRFDVAGEEWTGAESDRAFAESVRQAGNVVLGADAAYEGLADPSRALAIDLGSIPALALSSRQNPCVEPRPLLLPPYAMLAAAPRAIGHTYTVLDADGLLRRHVPFVRVGDRDVPSLAVAAAMLVGRSGPPASAFLRGRVTNADGDPSTSCRTLIPYRGPSNDQGGSTTFRRFSFYDLFYSEQQILEGQRPELDPTTFADRIVVIGATASGTFDVFPSPWGLLAPGAEVHANVIDALLNSRSIAPMALAPGLLAVAVPALLVGGSAAIGSVWLAAALAALSAAVVVWTSIRFFAAGVWMPLVAPLTAIALTFLAYLAWRYFVEGREKRQVKRLFSRYVAKDVYEQLLKDPDAAALGGQRRTMTVLFCDVRGFTALSEQATPEEVVGQLNQYFSRMVQVLFAHRGTLDKFIGDMVMGLFGAPLDDADHAEHAVQAGVAMIGALADLNREWAAAGQPLLDIGIGIATGEMVAGNIGSDTIMSYTVIGDTVNLGARLESLNKQYGSRMIISDATRQTLRGQYDIQPLGEVLVKGKSRPVTIYEVKS